MGRRSGYSKVHLGELTGRQREVLAQVAAGKTNQEIAESLGIGFESVKSHVSDILLRLDVSTREEASEVWHAEHGMLARVRRMASAFVTSLPGKLALGAATASVAIGITLAILLSPGDDSQGESNTDAFYLLDDGREAHQALAELSMEYGFEVVMPAGDEFRLVHVIYSSGKQPLLIGGHRSVTTVVRDQSGERHTVAQVNTDVERALLPADGSILEQPVPSSDPAIRIVRRTSTAGTEYRAYGRGRAFVFRPVESPDEALAVRMVHALFEGAPNSLPDPGTSYPNPNFTRVIDPGQEEPYELVDSFTSGTDFDVATDAERARAAASRAAGFEIALPGVLPAGVSLSLIRVPAVFADPGLRSVYISLVVDATGRSLVLTQHNVELPPPPAIDAKFILSPRSDIRAWQIGDIHNPAAESTSLMVTGRGRTVGLELHSKSLTVAEGLAMLISTIDAASP